MSNIQTGSATPNEAEQIRLLTVRTDEAERSLAEERRRADSLAADRDGLKADLTTVKERLAETEAKLAAGASAVETAATLDLKRRLDAAELAMTQLKASIPEMVRQRANLVAKANAVLPAMRCDGLTDREIMVQAVRSLKSKEPTGPDVSDDYLRRRLDALIEDRTAHGASMTRAAMALAPRQPAPTSEKRNDELDWANRWKGGLGQYATNSTRKD